MNNIILLRINNSIKSSIRSLLFWQEKLYGYFFRLASHLAQIKYRFEHLADSNLELALFHLSNGDYFDAYLRLKFIVTFLDKGNSTAYYLLGWSHFLRGQYQQAEIALGNAESEDDIGLKDFIKNINYVQTIPIDIYAALRELHAVNFMRLFNYDENIIPKIALALAKFTHSLPENYTILEIGCNISLLTQEIINNFSGKFSLEGIEISENMLNLGQQALLANKNSHHFQNVSPHDYLANMLSKYDMIISLEGVDYEKNIRQLLARLADKLRENGYLAFGCFQFLVNKNLPGKNFSSKLGRFIYNHYQISQDIELDFNVLYSTELAISNEIKYCFYICSKKNTKDAAL